MTRQHVQSGGENILRTERQHRLRSVRIILNRADVAGFDDVAEIHVHAPKATRAACAALESPPGLAADAADENI